MDMSYLKDMPIAVLGGGVVTNECKVEDRITTIRGC